MVAITNCFFKSQNNSYSESLLARYLSSHVLHIIVIFDLWDLRSVIFNEVEESHTIISNDSDVLDII